MRRIIAADYVKDHGYNSQDGFQSVDQATVQMGG